MSFVPDFMSCVPKFTDSFIRLGLQKTGTLMRADDDCEREMMVGYKKYYIID